MGPTRNDTWNKPYPVQTDYKKNSSLPKPALFAEEEFSSEEIDSTNSSSCGDEDSSASGSAPTTPKRGKTDGASALQPGTPTSTNSKMLHAAKVRFAEMDPEYSLTREEQVFIEEVIEKVSQLPDTPVKRQRSTAARDLICEMFILLNQRRPINLDDPDCHRLIARTLEISEWVKHLLEELSIIDYHATHRANAPIPAAVNVSHLTSPVKSATDKTRGFHYCPPSHRLRKDVATCSLNPTTNVWSGFYNKKFSTFFPDWIDELPKLLKCIIGSETVCNSGNRQLRKVEGTDQTNSFYLEVFLRAGGRKLQSAFPLFCREIWSPNRYFQITGTYTITSDDVLAAQKQLGENAIRYEDDDTITVDLAPALRTKDTIVQGIYFVIPKAEL